MTFPLSPQPQFREHGPPVALCSGDAHTTLLQGVKVIPPGLFQVPDPIVSLIGMLVLHFEIKEEAVLPPGLVHSGPVVRVMS